MANIESREIPFPLEGEDVLYNLPNGTKSLMPSKEARFLFIITSSEKPSIRKVASEFSSARSPLPDALTLKTYADLKKKYPGNLATIPSGPEKGGIYWYEPGPTTPSP